MATLIPIEGELKNIEPPKNPEQVLHVLQEALPGLFIPNFEGWTDRDAFLYPVWMSDSRSDRAKFLTELTRTPAEKLYNRVATRFIAQRGGEVVVFGPSIYFSANEWLLFHKPKTPEKKQDLTIDPVVEALVREESPNAPTRTINGELWMGVEGGMTQLRERYGAVFDTSHQLWFVRQTRYAEALVFVANEKRGKTASNP